MQNFFESENAFFPLLCACWERTIGGKRELFHFLDDNCINATIRVCEKTSATPLFVAHRYVARQDSRLIRGSAGRGKAPFNAFRTDIYPALSQWKLIAWLFDSLTRFFSLSLFISLARARIQRSVPFPGDPRANRAIILTINYFELELVQGKRKKKNSSIEILLFSPPAFLYRISNYEWEWIEVVEDV